MAIKQVPPSYYASTGILNEILNSVANPAATTTAATTTAATTTAATTTAATTTAATTPVPSKLQTKNWRREQQWYKGGRKTECEKVQRIQIETITGKKCPKTHTRINKRTYQMKPFSNPMKNPDGYDWTEDLDGEQQLVGKDGTTYKLLYNCKMVCDAGGTQTRTLRDVYEFIEAQQHVLLLGNHANVYFINILEGNQSYLRKKHFIYLLNLPEYASVKEKVFIDDMCAFDAWFQARF